MERYGSQACFIAALARGNEPGLQALFFRKRPAKVFIFD
jgi:hypothetical protein